MFNRQFKLPLSRSFFLFGARSTGKSTYLQKHLPDKKALWIDLLDPDLEQSLKKSPSTLNAILANELARSKKARRWVVIDEIQKVPELLSVVHKQIQQKNFKFALTGSSARKLKRGGADLLAGRASLFEMFPLTVEELSEEFNLHEVLKWGSLPEIFELNEADKKRFLKSYCNIYLKEEVLLEQLVRKAQPFREFLGLVALQNSQVINYSKFAKDCDVDTVTVQNYFEILKDTLLGFELAPFHESVRKRSRKNPKFYFFDTGVTRALAKLLEDPLLYQTHGYGKVFEQFIINEIYRLIKYNEKDWGLSYLLTKDGAEIDLIIEKNKKSRIAIEIKSSKKIDLKRVAAFERLGSDISGAKLFYLSQDKIEQKYGQVECLHWRTGLEKIFQ